MTSDELGLDVLEGTPRGKWAAKVAAGAVLAGFATVKGALGTGKATPGRTRAWLGRVQAGRGVVRMGLSPVKIAPGTVTAQLGKVKAGLGKVKIELSPPLLRPGHPVSVNGSAFRERGARIAVDAGSNTNFIFTSLLRQLEGEVPENVEPRVARMKRIGEALAVCLRRIVPEFARSPSLKLLRAGSRGGRPRRSVESAVKNPHQPSTERSRASSKKTLEFG